MSYQYLLWICILFFPASALLCKNIAKVFQKQTLFGTQTKIAFRNVTMDIPSDILCIVGTSGSGKSTLAKCVCLLEDISFGSLSWSNEMTIHGRSNSMYPVYICSSYLGLQYKETYDFSKCVSHYVVPFTLLGGSYHPSFVRTLKLAYDTLEIESILGLRLNSLLESQRAAFNVFTGIQSSLLSQSIQKLSKDYVDMLKRWGGLTASRVLPTSECSFSSDLPLDTPVHLSLCVVLDEHLDKMASSVRQSLLGKVRRLIAALDSEKFPVANEPAEERVDDTSENRNHGSTKCIAIVVTHSARVLRDCNGHSAVMNNGRLYDLQNSYLKLTMPAQLQLLE